MSAEIFTEVGCAVLPAAVLSTQSGADSGKKERKEDRKKDWETERGEFHEENASVSVRSV